MHEEGEEQRLAKKRRAAFEFLSGISVTGPACHVAPTVAQQVMAKATSPPLAPGSEMTPKQLAAIAFLGNIDMGHHATPVQSLLSKAMSGILLDPSVLDQKGSPEQPALDMDVPAEGPSLGIPLIDLHVAVRHRERERIGAQWNMSHVK
jgi:hypothetical protein